MDGAISELARPARHHLRLERLAAKALAAEDFIASFRYADRRCRIDPPPLAHCFVLRAEAAWRLGQRDAALADIARALQISPHDIGANRRLLAWADDDGRRQAARELLASDTGNSSLRSAMAVLREAGERCWAALSIYDSEIVGWVAWSGDAEIEASLNTADGSLTSVLDADPFHPLATSRIQATALRLRRAPSSAAQTLTLRLDRRIFRTYRLPPVATPPLRPRPASPPAERRDVDANDRAVPTVIVPVYGDVDATIACLDSLCRARAVGSQRGAKAPFQILAVDDGSPEPALKAHLQALAALQDISLLVNATNQGFIGAVNRALAQVPQGDVVLLNADTVVPPGFVERLMATAYSAPDIGTVTPLSNNGEFFSFPLPDTANAMLPEPEIIARDKAAEQANTAEAVDMPSGIGFCLYIKRAVLDRIGPLSESFQRGYLEDVDFCLRARTAGFRNVCAPSVYVGHHGSLSFQMSKRALVLRNFDILDRRFPSYRAECRAIETADPLRLSRAALEAMLPARERHPTLIVAGRGALRPIAEARARQLINSGEHAVILSPQQARLTFRLAATDGEVPQSLLLRFDSPSAIAEAEGEIARLRPARIEAIDPACPTAVTDIARRLGVALDRWLTTADVPAIAGLSNERVLAPSEAALRYAQSRKEQGRPTSGRQERIIRADGWSVHPLALADAEPERPCSLVVIPTGPSSQAWQAIRAVAHQIRASGKPIPIVVAGETLDDNRLMSFPNLFVTGPVAIEELPDLLAPHNPGWILTDFEVPLFGHPLVEAARLAPRPVAYRNWAGDGLEPRTGDLALPGTADDEALAAAVTRWITTS
ncbi:Glycosyl transferase, family 2 [Bradyrhizobium sp. ORS 375]|uniref:glycosyltransferase n=1 Tax=Bradyrhizobium sp. (strain ORS 375) TaxID=566679 RepID=UPI000240ACF0|nr:glycosyltransferase [Bradyrhizobium sp. ORS 375]CCD91748.1 Glycosyl transferase, family 2 [Bradyrhizobium sp. ORS 375]